MEQIFNGIKDILKEYFVESSEYNYVNGKQFIIDAENDFIYGIDFPKTANIPTPINDPSKRPRVSMQNIFTKVYFRPQNTTHIHHYTTQTEVVGNPNQILVQNYNEYIGRFSLGVYTKSPQMMFDMDAFNFKELFFNTFRGNLPFLDFLFTRQVWAFGWENYDVIDISNIESMHGISRYEASCSARYRQETNSYIYDTLQKIKIDTVKTF